MEKSFAAADPELVTLLEQLVKPVDAELASIAERTKDADIPEIQVGPFDGRHLEVLVSAVGAKRVLEIGTLGGYSGLCLLRGMGLNGKLVTLEFEPKHAEFARETFKRAGFESQAEVIVGPALSALPTLVDGPAFDLVFIDADKVNYSNYLDWAYKLLRKGGVLLADNVFAWGYLTNPDTAPNVDMRNSVLGIKAFNEKLTSHQGFRTTYLPTGEGLALAVKL